MAQLFLLAFFLMHTTDHTNRSKCCIDLFTQSDLDNRLPAAMAAARRRREGSRRDEEICRFSSVPLLLRVRGRSGPGRAGGPCRHFIFALFGNRDTAQLTASLAAGRGFQLLLGLGPSSRSNQINGSAQCSGKCNKWTGFPNKACRGSGERLAKSCAERSEIS